MSFQENQMANTLWSDYIQRIGTLYLSRALRFDDTFKQKYVSAFAIEGKKDILEIGCGPGALCESLHKWYPNANIVGVDRDSRFIEFAKAQAPEIKFYEQDAACLSFADESFDVTISNTVAEHIEPSKFFGEQYRVLKPNGVCIVLSSRRGISHTAPCISEETDFEREIWARADERFSNIHKKYDICSYPMNELEYPTCMEKYGFSEVSTEYITINLTPDNPFCSRETAHRIINENRQSQLDNVDILETIASDIVSKDEIAKLKELINQKYEERLQLYDGGIKQWDTNVSVIMVMRGIKQR